MEVHVTVGVHVVSRHLRGGEAVLEGVQVVVLLLQGGDAYVLLLEAVVRPQGVQVRGQTATGGRWRTREGEGVRDV